MRLIGGKDYYDGAVGFDNDNQRVFIRDRLEFYTKGQKDPIILPVPEFNQDIRIEFDATNYRMRYGYTTYNDPFTKKDYIMGTEMVYFCGFLYRYEVLKEVINNGVYGTEYKTERFITTFDEYQEFFLDRFNQKLAKRPKRKMYPFEKKYITYYSDNISDYFKPIPVNSEYLRQNKVICAIYVRLDRNSDRLWALNTDGLDTVGFQKIMSQWQAYQEIEMFPGTILVDDADKMVKLSDDKVLTKHGFDKWSFRNKVHPAKPRGNAA